MAVRPIALIVAAFAAMLVLDVLRGEEPPGFWAAFGLVAGAVLILGTKWLGGHWLWRTPADDDDPMERG